MEKFSSLHRSTTNLQLSQESFDLVVVGGGITGAGIALDAVSRGLKVALVEMQDFSAGTSSRSTKLIHGGLRYLKQLEFGLVAEVGRERAIIHRHAPHLAKPEKMLLPIIKGGSMTTWTARIGMWVYETLAKVKKTEGHRYLSPKETIAIEPTLNKEELLGSILFYEYRTDDARLTIDVIKKAHELGAVCQNYVKAIGLSQKGDEKNVLEVEDMFSSEKFTITSTYVVNAAGPWVDTVDDLFLDKNTHKLQLTKGIHLVVKKDKFPAEHALYIDAPDGRMIFVIPRGDAVYIGTTDTFYSNDLKHPVMTQADIQYLLKAMNHYFPNFTLEKKDCISSWCGIRPLVNKPGKGPSEISRKDELFVHPHGIITIAGGKLTGYRKMAQRVVDVIASEELKKGRKLTPCLTDKLAPSGGMSDGFATFLKSRTAKLTSFGLSPTQAEAWVYRLGQNLDLVISSAEKDSSFPSIESVVRAHVQYCMEHEKCVTLSDFFIRRTSSLYFDVPFLEKWKTLVSETMAVTLGWSESQKLEMEKELADRCTEVSVEHAQ